MGSITNGKVTLPFENANALGRSWRKASRTDLGPMIPDEDCVLVAAGPHAKDHPHPKVSDGTRMIEVTDSKDPAAPVLAFTRVEFTKFCQGVKDGEFDDLMATDADLEGAGAGAVSAT
ncbi:hypothetical protein Stsp02_22720 [Streptomyces sp. NBRC 14336]|uniref:DUF397 domain-containing protein n=1 Tax=Streptomyces sp. NBRC 14336 TaxID=3030992 RepID=UPI0024A436C4|nr:DUF397 domain-containing protein [Streptomyces sp. NBRC 14336]GLW46610.1 hypothetical protein Stsp02_22720 [Streptomyces sp. NBRC 14336]